MSSSCGQGQHCVMVPLTEPNSLVDAALGTWTEPNSLVDAALGTWTEPNSLVDAALGTWTEPNSLVDAALGTWTEPNSLVDAALGTWTEAGWWCLCGCSGCTWLVVLVWVQWVHLAGGVLCRCSGLGCRRCRGCRQV